MDGPFQASLKVREEDFDELTNSPGIIPAPYLTRYKWTLVQEPQRFNPGEWEFFVRQSYELVKSNLSEKARQHFS